MGLLADIFSTADTAKRRLSGLLSDPLGTLALGVTRFGEDQGGLLNMTQNAYPMAGNKTVLNTPEQVAQFRQQVADKGTDMAMAGMTTGKFVYPQDEALATAQRNAAKPVSEGGLGLRPDNTPMERAKALGFADDVFHGQAQPNPKREYIEGLGSVVVDQPALSPISQLRTGGGNAEGGAFFAVNDPFVANGYAGNGAVYPLKVPTKSLKESGVPSGGNVENFNRMLDKNKTRYFNSELKQARNEGFGGAVFRNVEDSAGQKLYDIPADIYGVSNPALVRSRFAAFDPMRRNEADILGRADPALLSILAGAGLLGVGAYEAVK